MAFALERQANNNLLVVFQFVSSFLREDTIALLKRVARDKIKPGPKRMCYVLCFNVLLQCCTYTYPHTIPHIKQAALIIICPWRKKIAWQTQKTASILVGVLNQHQHPTLPAL